MRLRTGAWGTCVTCVCTSGRCEIFRYNQSQVVSPRNHRNLHGPSLTPRPALPWRIMRKLLPLRTPAPGTRRDFLSDGKEKSLLHMTGMHVLFFARLCPMRASMAKERKRVNVRVFYCRISRGNCEPFGGRSPGVWRGGKRQTSERR